MYIRISHISPRLQAPLDLKVSVEHQVSPEGLVSLVPLDHEERLDSLDHKELQDCLVDLEVLDQEDPLVLQDPKDSLEHQEALDDRVDQVKHQLSILFQHH